MQSHQKKQFITDPWIRFLVWALLFIIATTLLTIAIHSLLIDNALGMDFHTFWQAGRSIVVFGENPYSEQVAIRSQLGAYRQLQSEGNQMDFAYPPYALIPILLLALLNYGWAQSIWMALSIMILVSTAFLLANQKNALIAVIAILIPYPIFFGIILGNYSVLIDAVIILSLGILTRNPSPGKWTQILLGFLLAWTTIKPQAVWIFLMYILWKAWINKQKFHLMAFSGSLFFFILFSFLLVPNWLTGWSQIIKKYYGYIQHSSPRLQMMLGELLSPPVASIVFIILVIILLAIIIYLLFQFQYVKNRQIWVVGWIAFATYLLHPTLFSYTQITLLIPLLLWLMNKEKKNFLYRFTFYIIFSSLTWIVTFSIAPLLSSPFSEDITFLIFVAWLIGLSLDLIPSNFKFLTGHPLRKRLNHGI